jgi:hypothetical protein
MIRRRGWESRHRMQRREMEVIGDQCFHKITLFHYANFSCIKLLNIPWGRPVLFVFEEHTKL